MTVIERTLKRDIQRVDGGEPLGWSLRGLQESGILCGNVIRDIVVHSIKPSREKGNHHHLKKTEWFIPIQGRAVLRWHDISKGHGGEFEISGESLSNYGQGSFLVYEIEPRTSHTVMNIDLTEFIIIAVSTEDFHQDDTIECETNV